MYISPNMNHQVKKDEMDRACSTNGEEKYIWRESQ
jgi:hypothetical protein